MKINDNQVYSSSISSSVSPSKSHVTFSDSSTMLIDKIENDSEIIIRDHTVPEIKYNTINSLIQLLKKQIIITVRSPGTLIFQIIVIFIINLLLAGIQFSEFYYAYNQDISTPTKNSHIDEKFKCNKNDPDCVIVGYFILSNATTIPDDYSKLYKFILMK